MLPVKAMNAPFLRSERENCVMVCHATYRKYSHFPFLALLVLLLISPAAHEGSAFGATLASGPLASAAGITGAEAQLNGARLTSGATLFGGDIVKLGAASSAALQFGNDLVLAASGSELVVES